LKALVLAGGAGTRLRPLTHATPKALVPVANRPILHYVMDRIAAVGITDIGVIISPQSGDQIRAALEDNPWKLDVTFVLQERPLGLAHTVVVAAEYLADDPFLMVLSDNLIGDGVEDLVCRFAAEGADAAVLLKEVADPSRFGVAVLDGDGRLSRVVEKPREFVSNLALVGVYCFSPAIHEAVRNIEPSWRDELEITDAIGYLIEGGRNVTAHRLEGWWMDCGNQTDLLAANRTVLSETVRLDVRGAVDGASRLVGAVSVADAAAVFESELRGPTALAAGAQVRRSVLGPNTSVGEGCVISDSRIEDCVILAGATIEGVNGLEGSLIGRRAVLRGRPPGSAVRVMVGDDAEVLL
jgi:glucose-1-phosphate thymidylyltransferase